MTKCKTCNTQLTTLTGVGWVHPAGINCPENDGLIIQNKYRDKWNAKYGTPTKNIEDYIKENILLKDEVKKWKTKNQKITKENNQLMTQNQALKAKSLKQKLLKVWKKYKKVEKNVKKE